MGLTGSIDFYTCRRITEPGDTLLKCARITGAAQMSFAFRSVGPYREWKDFLLQRGRARRYVGGVFFETATGPPYEHLAGPAPIESIATLYKPRTAVTVSLSSSPLLELIREATDRDIPESVRGRLGQDAGGFHFSFISLVAGWHDIFEWTEHPGGHLFARAFFSISFQGNLCPLHWEEYRRLVFQVPEVQEAKRKFEAVLGPLEECAYWHA